jgi:ABC-2 type transport system ATP-binding protein
MIIDHGRLLYDGPLAELKEKLLRTKQVKFVLRDGEQARALRDFEELLARAPQGKSLRLERLDEMTCRIRFDRSRISTSDLIRQILAAVEVRDLLIEDEPIEEIVKRIYAGEAFGKTEAGATVRGSR